MARRRDREIPVAAEETAPVQEKRTDDRFLPDEKLQAYYNDAYINERDRLNSMFGRIDTYPVVQEKIVYRDPDLTNYIPVQEYKKKKRCATCLGVFFGIALVAAAVFAFLFFTK